MQGELWPSNVLDGMFNGDTQVCRSCQKEKPLEAFPLHKNNATGLDTRCKKCKNKIQKLVKQLRLDYEHLKTEVCDCCGKAHVKSLVLDHDHNTGEFRGWLCEPCNLALGHLGDDVQGAENALAYLKRHYEQE